METRRIDDLLNRLEQLKLVRTNEPDPDGLSLSLWAMGAELAALDEIGLAAEAEALGITPDDVRELAQTYTRRTYGNGG